MYDLQDTFTDAHEDENWKNHVSSELRDALEKLDERSRDIIFHRWLSNEKSTLSELGEKHSISAERVRQLELSTLTRLKALLGNIPMMIAA
ncbi:sigma factor-like helix-turn-helix DNA-binding protein [Vibrio methylphosphonaticus]|uniref:sigma factor-like helix-turn-helix DNA-binding protein n=1 Tax=Vibrio methylphosphonaticus TaxID=2946866 RepID=UPI00202A5418|nr:sigma factor-like helix-turn-helix DNA-binding protein [Vibrio methylphosphonaticus]MCL9775630.1 hypothetical protein [Vibrio methylphosphonaticus]